MERYLLRLLQQLLQPLLLLLESCSSIRFLAAHRLLKGKTNGSFRREEVVMNREEFRQCGANVKGLIVDENGVDVIYFRN
ncbi:hypothetical protein Prudu_014852 [Prunus dulcis]|uniref:Uncharacterized protein n=1 Tax=Prunus dulcis TaxID=3755 RepID=A0A4Y1RI19_PRUDU|nr:hypothetical protein Prudu_014852 [Prunus dulcis]